MKRILYIFSIFTLCMIAFPPNFVIPLFSNKTPQEDTAPQLIDSIMMESSFASSRVPLRSVTIVASTPSSYLDDFAYITAVPTTVFLYGTTQYISPLVFADGSQSESWLLEDWAEYLSTDGGATRMTVIGNISFSEAAHYTEIFETPIRPWIRANTIEEIAALLALSDWQSSNIAVFSPVQTDFLPIETTESSESFTFENDPIQIVHQPITISSSNPAEISFTPPAGTGWIQASFDWTGSVYFTHTLRDPTGRIVDYSVPSQTYQERFSSYVESPVPLQFWVPNTVDGEWRVTLHPETTVDSPVELESTFIYHPGHSTTLSIPQNAESLSLDVNWDNSATDINVALIDPTGQVAAWAPAGSIIASPGEEHVEVSYPMPGNWNVVVTWMNATSEQNNVNLSWRINTLPTNLQSYLESAANAAVLASLLNAPLLYVSPDKIPEATRWAAEKLGVTVSFLVDPYNLQQSSLITELEEFSFVNNLNNFNLVTYWIHQLSNKNDIVISVPKADGDELLAIAAFSGAVHGAPVFSLCGSNNFLTTKAEATWVPYLIGPEIDIYVRSRYTTRTENGWYDERIPNRYAMEETANAFETFLDERGAYNASTSQPVLVIASLERIKPSFDRALQSHFNPGRIPTDSAALASVMINRAALHRFLFLVADSANDALVSMYAYTEGAGFVDNNFNYYLINQYENSTQILQDAGFNIRSHIGYHEVFSAVASQVALWTFSTHGTLTRYPTDPPDRPLGLGLFSLRDEDAPYGMESSTVRDVNGDHLINPVLYESESAHHRIESTATLESAIDNIGSPIVIVTACLLGGTRLPLMLMEHGAVAVMASPRTVYFQPAAMVSLLVLEKLAEGATTGEALSYALKTISADYTDPPSGEPRDYANQHILFGDPEVQLFDPDIASHVPAVDIIVQSFGTHTPSRGVPPVAVFGDSSILSTVLTQLAIEHDFFTTTNYSNFVRTLPLYYTIIVESNLSATLSDFLQNNQAAIASYVLAGGTFVVFGVSNSLHWLPWLVNYDPSLSGTNITILDSSHPLMSNPNLLPAIIPFVGYLTPSISNFTILATATNGQPVILSSTIGYGKLALMTIHPTGTLLESTLENIVEWYKQPSILLRDITLNEVVIWAGDRVTITLELIDNMGRGVQNAELFIEMNNTDVSSSITELGSGVYQLLLDEAWTNQHPGLLTITVHVSKSGYDTLTVTIPEFIYIRPSPWLGIIVGSGVFVVLIVGYFYYKKRRGDDILPFRKRDYPLIASPPLTKEERKRLEEEERKRRKEREKKDSEIDPREILGI